MGRTQAGKILVFSAPSGAGKTSLLKHLRQAIPELVYSVSATTRSPREGEIEGTHYYFLSEEEFKSRLARNEFAEWQLVHGNYYGTPRDLVDRTTAQGKHIILDIDVFGKKKFDKAYPQAVGILVLAPSMAVLEERLRGRQTDGEDTIRLRVANAREELEFARTEGKYEHTIVNDDFERSRAEVVELVKSLIAH